MSDLLSQALFPVNLPFTILLVGLAGYWLLVSLGALNLESGESLDLANADAELDTSGGPLSGILHFLNVGEVPLLVILSVLTLSMWVCGILANFYLNASDSILLGIVYLVPAFVLSAVFTRFATLPLRHVFRLLHQPEPTDRPLVGQTCVIRTREASATYGQAEVASDGAPLLIQVRTRPGETLPAGATALIISQDPQSGSCSVIPVTNDQLDNPIPST